jgi:membrane protein implicated in regulation of membrane protease activity
LIIFSMLAEFGALVWLAIALVAAVVEISVPHFGFAFVGVGAVVAAAVAYFGFSVPAQLGTFVVVLILSLAFLRSRLVGVFGKARGIPSRTSALVDRSGVVTEAIDPVRGSGRVNVGGEDWAARSAVPLAVGTQIRVTGADGIVLEVTQA